MTGTRNHAWFSFVFLAETRFHLVSQADLELLTSSDLSSSASQSAGITDMHPHAWFSDFIYFLFFRWSLTLSPRMEYDGVVSTHCNLHLPGFSAHSLSSSWTTGICHHAWLIYVFLVEMGFHYVGPDGLELLTSSDPFT